MKSFYESKNIAVTGGTGSIGSSIVGELLKYNPQSIRVLSNDENSLFEIKQKYQDNTTLRFLHTDVRDLDRLKTAFKNVDVVFHAAAMKHVPICEYNPFEALKTNTIGTQNVIEAALETKVQKVLTISTDKAVNPTTTMGATKLLAEKLTVDGNNYRGYQDSRFSCIRFGNVLASRGSIIPIFIKQIEQGGSVTVTDKNMTRFFVSIEEAVDLVLKCAEVMEGGEIFVLKNMQAVRILDLAEVLIETLDKSKRTKIKYISKRFNEKLHEELLTIEEFDSIIETDEMYIILAGDIARLKYDTKFSEFNINEISYRSDKVSLLNKAEILEILINLDLLPNTI